MNSNFTTIASDVPIMSGTTVKNDNELSLFVVPALLVYGCWRLVFRPYLETKKPFAELPMVPNSHWLMGNVQSNDKFIETQKRNVDAGGELGRVGMWRFNKRCMMVGRWEDARTVLNSESWREINPVVKKSFDFLIPNTILGMNGKHWKHNRAAINKALNPATLKASAGVMVDVVASANTALKNEISKCDDSSYTFEVESLMKMITLDVFGKSTFSTDFGCTRNLKFNSFAEIFQALFKPEANKFKIRKLLHSYILDMIKERQKEGNIKKKDLLSNIIEANSTGGKIVSNDVLRDVVITVLAAGYDTTAITLTYAMYLLSGRPDIVANCLEEIASVQSLKDDYDDLVYYRAVITETLRLFPPAAATSRIAQKPIKLSDGYIIPTGTIITIPIFTIHRDERNFERPLDFIPERWVTKQKTGGDASAKWRERKISDSAAGDSTNSSYVPAGNPKAFFAFSGGGRSCPGMKFAWQEATVVMAGLLKDFKFETLPDYQLNIVLGGPIHHPNDKLPMKISLRD